MGEINNHYANKSTGMSAFCQRGDCIIENISGNIRAITLLWYTSAEETWKWGKSKWKK